jgi:hypothetical protein
LAWAGEAALVTVVELEVEVEDVGAEVGEKIEVMMMAACDVGFVDALDVVDGVHGVVVDAETIEKGREEKRRDRS